MRRVGLSHAVLVTLISLFSVGALLLQTAPVSGQTDGAASPGASSPKNAGPQLPPEQQENFDGAVRLFNAQRYSEALTKFQQILSVLPQEASDRRTVAKYAAEAAINTGDRDFALRILKPIEAADGNDWQAAGLLARIYAETGQKQQRDAELAHLVDLHKRVVQSPIAKLQQILLERIPVMNGSILVWYSLEPWGKYKTYLFSRVYDQAGHQVLRVTLESSDLDQLLFAKEHPDEAARGVRLFSLDGYGEVQTLPNGGRSGSHMTFGFYDGEPPYDTVRDRIIQIAEGRDKPLSQTQTTVPNK